MSNKSNSDKPMRESEDNVISELACLEDINTQWDWLLTHLEVYLVRLQELCDKLGKPPGKFMQTSIFYNLIIATDLAEHRLVSKRNTPLEWISFRESINDLSDAEDVSSCLRFWKSICELEL